MGRETPGEEAPTCNQRWEFLVLLASLCLLRRRMFSAAAWASQASFIPAMWTKKPLADQQLLCPHPRDNQRNSGNQHGSYVHCMDCGLRLEYVTAEDRADGKTKVKEKTCQARGHKPRRRALGVGLSSGMALSSGQGALEEDVLKLAEAQNQQTQLLGRQLRSMASAQAQAAQAQQQQSTMLEHLLANLAETQAQSSQLLVVTMRGLQRTVERFSQDGANLKTEPCCKKTGPLKQPQAEQFVICSEAAASENNEFSDSS